MNPRYVFGPTVSGAGTGTDPTRFTQVKSVTAITRAGGIYCPALSTVCIHISGTATVKIISNPFDDAAKDKVLTTLTSSGEYVVASAQNIIIDVTAVTGTVTAMIVANIELDN
jgi:hypothetical protein